MNAERDVGKQSNLEAGAFYILRNQMPVLAIGPDAVLSMPRGLPLSPLSPQEAIRGPLNAVQMAGRYPWYDVNVLETLSCYAKWGEIDGY
jgi:hypothetical protein